MPEGIGYDLPTQGPQQSPEQVKQNEESWFSKLKEWQASPEAIGAFMQIGSALSQPQAYGQSAQGQITNAIAETGPFLDRLRSGQRKDREQDIRTRDVSRLEAGQRSTQALQESKAAATARELERRRELTPSEVELNRARALDLRRGTSRGSTTGKAHRIDKLTQSFMRRDRLNEADARIQAETFVRFGSRAMFAANYAVKRMAEIGAPEVTEEEATRIGGVIYDEAFGATPPPATGVTPTGGEEAPEATGIEAQLAAASAVDLMAIWNNERDRLGEIGLTEEQLCAELKKKVPGFNCGS